MLLDVLGCQTALFEWAESYDTKDWDRLAKCVAPTVRVSLVTFLLLLLLLLLMMHVLITQCIIDRLPRFPEQALGSYAG